MLAQQKAKTRRVQNRPRSDHPRRRQPRKFTSRVGQHIDRIRRYQQNSVRIMLRDLRHDRAPDAGIVLDAVQSRLSRFLTRSRRQHCDRGACTIGVVSGPNACGMSERNRVAQVHGFALSLGPVIVDQDDFCGKSAQQQSISKRRSNVPRADHRHTHRS
jgi:hypothetical protein